MRTVDTILRLARQAKTEGISLESARLCTVCWTVHEEDSCPECAARQWLHLAPMLRGFEYGNTISADTAPAQRQ